MTASRFHVSENGPMPCTAKTPASCPIQGEHFENFHDAQALFDMQMEAEYGMTHGITKRDPYSPYSRYGANADTVPLEDIEPDSQGVEHIDEDTVLHHVNFSTPDVEEQIATKLNISPETPLQIFRIYSVHEELRIGTILQRQHGLRIADQHHYAPESVEFVIRTGQDLTYVDQQVAQEHHDFEQEVLRYGTDTLSADYAKPEESTTSTDSVSIGRHLKSSLSAHDRKGFTIHDSSHATQYFRSMTDAEKERYGYSNIADVNIFAEYRSEDATLNVTMGVEVDGKKFYETRQDQPMIHTFEIDRQETVDTYLNTIKTSTYPAFVESMYSNRPRLFMDAYTYSNVMGYEYEEDDTVDPEFDFDIDAFEKHLDKNF